MSRTTPGPTAVRSVWFSTLRVLGSVIMLGTCHAPAGAGTVQAAAGPAVFRSWDVDSPGGKLSVQESWVPVWFDWDWRENVSLHASAEASGATLDEPLASSHLSALSHASVQALWRLPESGASLTGGITLPSGQRVIQPEDQLLTRAIALPVFGFPCRQLGRGTEVRLGGGVSRSVSDRVMLSGGIGGSYRGPYEWQQGAADYHPASDLAFTLGGDWLSAANDVGDRSRPARVDLTYRHFSSDQVGDSTVFDEGGQWELHALASFGMLAINNELELRRVFKSASRQASGIVSGPPQVEWNTGDAFILGWRAAHPWSVNRRFGVALEYANFFSSDVAERNGRAVDAGAWVDIGIARGTSLHLGGSRLWGKLDTASGAELDADGASWSLGLTYSPPAD